MFLLFNFYVASNMASKDAKHVKQSRHASQQRTFEPNKIQPEYKNYRYPNTRPIRKKHNLSERLTFRIVPTQPILVVLTYRIELP